MSAKCYWSPGAAFKHHSLVLEVDDDAKGFDDGSSHQHWCLTLDDEGLAKSKIVVDKDWNSGNPMARRGMVTTEMKSSGSASHLNGLSGEAKVFQVGNVALKGS